MKHALVIANSPDDDWYSQSSSVGDATTIVALDGAYLTARKKGLNVDVLLGDLDSISQEDINQIDSTCTQVLEIKNQNTTDLDKAIEYLDDQQHDTITVLNALGGRTDHYLHNIQALIRHYRADRPITIQTCSEKIYAIRDQSVVITASIGTGIGLIGAPIAIINSNGLQYELNNFFATFGERDSTSNAMIESKLHLDVQGTVIVIEYLQRK